MERKKILTAEFHWGTKRKEERGGGGGNSQTFFYSQLNN